MRPASPGIAEDAGELIGLPAFHLLVIALSGPPLRLVTGPVQATAEQAEDVVGVVLDAEVAVDDLGDAGRRPQLVGEAVGGSPLVQESFEFPQLKVGQPAFGTGNGLGGEAVALPSHPPPTVQGGACDAQDAGHHGGSFALVH